MISVGYEDYPNGGSTQYWEIYSAIRSFEWSTKKSIHEIVAENYKGKTASQIIREGGSISYGNHWINFSDFNEASLEKEIAEAKQSIETMSKKDYVDSSLFGCQIRLKELEYQLKAFRYELPPKPLPNESEVSIKKIEQTNDSVVSQPYIAYESLFINLVFDDTYKPNKKTIRSADVLASFGYDWTGGEERLLDQDEMIIKRVLTAGNEDYSKFTVFYLEYYCWVCPDKISKIMSDPNMLRKWGTRVLIEKEALLEDEDQFYDMCQGDGVDWIEAESIDSIDYHIGTDDIPKYVIDNYIGFIEDNSGDAGSYYEDYVEDEGYVSKLDPRIRETFQLALDKYIAKYGE